MNRRTTRTNNNRRNSSHDELMERINNMPEVEIRMVLQNLCLLHPHEVEAAVTHVQRDDDMYSVATQQRSNKTEFIPPPIGKLSRSTSGGDSQPHGGGSPIGTSARPSPTSAEGSGSMAAPARRQPSVCQDNGNSHMRGPAPAPPSSQHQQSRSLMRPDQTTSPSDKDQDKNTQSFQTRPRPSVAGEQAIDRLPQRGPSKRQTRMTNDLSLSMQTTASGLTLDPYIDYDTSEEFSITSPPVAPSGLPNTSNGAAYLVYDSDGARLIVHYSKKPVAKALGMWYPTGSSQIKGFKFLQNHGKSELIGNCAAGVTGRKNYYSGWCQFVRQARALNGIVTIYSTSNKDGLEIDLFAYSHTNSSAVFSHNSVRLNENIPFASYELSALACLAKKTDFYHNMNVDLTKWKTEANALGATTEFTGSPSMRRKSDKPMKAPRPPPDSVSPAIAPASRKAIGTGNNSFSSISSAPPSLGINTSTPNSSTTSITTGACYLVYDHDLGKLLSHYSRTSVSNALGMWVPGEGRKIQGFKFQQNHGKSELIGNCAAGVAGRKNYCSGWCQFVKQAKSMVGTVTLLSGEGLPVDVYFYFNAGQKTHKLQPDETIQVRDIDGVACLPRSARFYDGSMSVDIIKWLNESSAIGASTKC